MTAATHTLDSGWAQAWFAGIPIVGGFIMGCFRLIRSKGRKEAEAAAKETAIAKKLAEHDAAIADITQGQKELRSALDHQTEVFTGRLDHQTDVLTNRLDRVVEALLSGKRAA